MSYRDTVLADDPQIFIPMDEGPTNIPVQLGKSSASFSSATAVRQENYWSFNSNQKAILSGVSSTIASSYATVAFWLRLNSYPASAYAFSFQGTYGYTSNALIGRLWTSSTASRLTLENADLSNISRVLADGEWHYITLLRDSAIYIDGQVMSTNVRPNGNVRFQGGLIIGGAYTSNHATDFVGDMGGFEYYSHRLTPERIQAHYEARLAELNGPSEYFTILSDGVEEPIQLEGAYLDGAVVPLNGRAEQLNDTTEPT